MHENWRPLLPTLVEAYLRRNNVVESQAEAEAEAEMPELSPFSINVYDMTTLETRIEIPRRQDQSTAEALVAAGYLGNAPIMPSVAISLKTLEMLRSIRLFHALFSLEAFTKLVCHTYVVGFHVFRPPLLHLIAYRSPTTLIFVL